MQMSEIDHMQSGALSHIRVLDLSRVFAGPWCAQLLADMGADVVKVEHPAGGDDVRRMGHAHIGPDGQETGEHASFLAMNRGKRSIAIDFATPEGQALIRSLASRADVIIENFLTGTLARYGLDYPQLSAINPALIYCSITGFGQTGPRRHERGYDAIFQAMSGVMSVTGSAEAGSEPCLIGYSASDINAGLYAAVAVLAALSHRDAGGGGRGQHIDVALLDAQIASMSHLVINHLLSGQTPVRAGSASQINAPWKAFDCADGQMMITIGNDRQFRAFAALLGVPQIGGDPRFATNAARLANRLSLMSILEPLVKQWRQAALREALVAAGISCAPINDLPQALDDEQVRARQMVMSLDHPVIGPIPQLANPIRFSESPVSYRRPPPLLDEHHDEVIHDWLGFQSSP